MNEQPATTPPPEEPHDAVSTANFTIRASSLSGWNDCQRRAFARSYPKLVADAGYKLRSKMQHVSGAFGTAVHAAAAHALRMKVAAKPIDENDTYSVAVAEFDKQCEEGVEYDKKSSNRENAIKQMKACTAAYIHGVLPRITDVIEIEQLTLAMVSKDKNLSGHADLVTSTAIRDIKTGRSGTGCHGQMGGYALLRKANTGVLPSELIVDHVPRSAVTKPHPGATQIKYSVQACVEEAANVIGYIEATIDKFVSKPDPVMIPANTMSMMCSENWCPAFGTDYCKLSKEVV